MQPLPDSRTLLSRLLQECKKESDRKCLSVSLTRPIARVAKYLGLKERSVHHYCSMKQTEKEKVPVLRVVKDVEKLINEGIAYIDKNKWAKACDHVLGFENKYWMKDNIQGHLIQPVIIHLGNESDDETEDDSADDGELADVDEADA